MKNIILPVATIIMLMSSCTKTGYKPTPTPPDAYINFDKTELEYVFLPFDRRFIYKDSATGHIDSVVVTDNYLWVSDDGPLPLLNLPAVHYQQYNLVLTKTNDSSSEWFNGSANSYYGTPTLRTTDSMAEIRFVARDNIITTAFPDYGFSSDTSSYVTYQYLSSLKVESKVYNDIMVCTYTRVALDTTAYENFKGTYYWAKKVGIIKRTVETSSGITTSLLESYGN
jgi:hypothetical protein